MKFASILVTICFIGSTAIGQNKGKKKGKAKRPQKATPLLTVRGDYQTKLVKTVKSDEPMDVPPEDSAFSMVKYSTKIGDMSAYLTKKPEDLEADEKLPAIVWLTGGIPPAGPGSYLWEKTKTSNEQSARIYRLKGLAMMFPTVRGTVKGNPGSYEGFYGEVEDVIAAGKYLKNLDYVDPKRVYLGGHSSGGTLALLTATATNQFAGVISLGPTEDHYGEEESPFEWNPKEINLRAPIKHLAAIRTPTYIIEGFDAGYSVNQLSLASKNPLVSCLLVAKANHFNVIHPVNSIFADAIVASETGQLTLDDKKIRGCYEVDQKRIRESSDLETLAEYRRKGMTFEKPRMVTFYLLAGERDAFKDIEGENVGPLYKAEPVTEHENSSGKKYYVLRLKKEIDLSDLKQLFKFTSAMRETAWLHDLTYDDWVAK